MLKRIAEASPRFKARMAGGLYLFSLLTAATIEIFAHGWLNIAGGLLAVAGMAAMTLLLYEIFKAVSRRLSLLAAALGLVGLTFEALRWQPQGVNVAVAIHGFYCILVAYLIFGSTFLPRILGALMAFAGLAWLTLLSPALAEHLSPYNLASGLLGDVSVFLWFLVMGVNAQRWNDEFVKTGEGRR